MIEPCLQLTQGRRYEVETVLIADKSGQSLRKNEIQVWVFQPLTR